MKTPPLLLVTVLLSADLLAAESSKLSFSFRKPDLPELSLREIAKSALLPKTPPPGQPGPVATPLLGSIRKSPLRPPVERPEGMLVIRPSDAVDYKMRIVEPDPNIDPGMLIEVKPAPRRK
jgi:hypothetical protein